jgi:hypothetical protein
MVVALRLSGDGGGDLGGPLAETPIQPLGSGVHLLPNPGGRGMAFTPKQCGYGPEVTNCRKGRGKP